MASLRKENDRGRKGWRLRFYLQKKRKSLWLGDMSKRAAETVSRHVDELVRAKEANVSANADTLLWSQGVDERIYTTLLKWGLVSPRKAIEADQRLCGPFFDSYVESRTDLGSLTINKYQQAVGWFTKKFGKDHPLESVTPADFDQWRRWMLDNGLSTSTANKHAKRIRRMFNEAVKAKILLSSPASESKIGGESNPERQHYITRSDANKILEKCDTEWALIFGLCRYAGFRCPTEVLGLTWSDVQWSDDRLRIDSVKTGLRFCPIFPELRPLLDAAWEFTGDRPAKYVIDRYRGNETNLRTQLHRIIESAGLKSWPKAFVNLRASCRTDLEEVFPAHVVNSWLGQSTAVANRHYLQVTDAHWEKAVAAGTNGTADECGGPTGGPISVNQASSGGISDDAEDGENPEKDDARGTEPNASIPPVGLEPTTNGLRVRCSTN